VRELQNIIERALILSPSGRLRFDLPSIDRAVVAGLEFRSPQETYKDTPVMTEDEIKALQKQNIIAALEQSGGRIYGKKGAAILLGIKPTTLTERMKAMRIKKEDNL
jgi:transcriptional regulator with GAF, ATPase, and Fis domain